MAIALDVGTNSGNKAGFSTYSFNHTCTGTNLCLVVVVTEKQTSFHSPVDVTGITYNTVALTKIRSDISSGANGHLSSMWYLTGPATGTHSVAVTFAGTADNSITSSLSFTGVDQSASLDANNGKNSPSTDSAITNTVTTIADNAWVIDVVYSDKASATFTANGSQVRDFHIDNTSTGNHLVSHFGPKTPAGSTTMAWTPSTTSGNWNQSIASLTPSTAAPVDLTLMWHPEVQKPYLDKIGITSY